MKLSFNGIFSAFYALSGIGAEIAEAKAKESDGGEEITAPEMVAIAARVAGAWCDAEGEKKRVSLESLRRAFESDGWTVYHADDPDDWK
jgi:hypothetical protein